MKAWKPASTFKVLSKRNRLQTIRHGKDLRFPSDPKPKWAVKVRASCIHRGAFMTDWTLRGSKKKRKTMDFLKILTQVKKTSLKKNHRKIIKALTRPQIFSVWWFLKKCFWYLLKFTSLGMRQFALASPHWSRTSQYAWRHFSSLRDGHHFGIWRDLVTSTGLESVHWASPILQIRLPVLLPLNISLLPPRPSPVSIATPPLGEPLSEADPSLADDASRRRRDASRNQAAAAAWQLRVTLR